jgi:hypothetical protein
MKHGKQIQLARKAKITGKYFNDIIAGRARTGRKLSVRLETLTGIPRMTWLFGSSREIKIALEVAFPNLKSKATHLDSANNDDTKAA